MLRCGDCLDVLPTLASGSVDAIVTDPPAGIAFMGKAWDTFPLRDDLVGSRKTGAGRDSAAAGFARGVHWQDTGKARDKFTAFLTEAMTECLRVLKPGAYGLVWALPRTSHWTGTALEEAGFEVRDRISHLFGTGFPKAQSCLKPACEDWWLVRKPGGKMRPLGIDECRVKTNGEQVPVFDTKGGRKFEQTHTQSGRRTKQVGTSVTGRWPANVTLQHHPACNGACHADCPVRMLDEQSGERPAKRSRCGDGIGTGYGRSAAGFNTVRGFDDAGGASRFFYCAKASRRERNAGLDAMPLVDADLFGDDPYTVHRNGDGKPTNGNGKVTPQRNTHPTVKPVALMSWLVSLVCPPGGAVLDPFAGSGTTGIACIATGRHFIGIEREAEYLKIARRRIAAAVRARKVVCA